MIPCDLFLQLAMQKGAALAVFGMSVCLSVCLSVCPTAYLSHDDIMSERRYTYDHEVFTEA